MAGPVRNLKLIKPTESSVKCSHCRGRLLKYTDDEYIYYCPECRLNVMVIEGESLEEVA